jgi:hypothetical protein
VKRLLALLVALVVLAGAAAPPPAAPSDAPAGGLDSSYVYVYEGSQTQSDDHFIIYKVDTGSIPNLSTWTMGLFAGCDNRYANWNNCITSVYGRVKTGSCLAFYDGTSYSTQLAILISKTTDWAGWLFDWSGTTKNDKATSIRWGDARQNPSTKVWTCLFGSYD